MSFLRSNYLRRIRAQTMKLSLLLNDDYTPLNFVSPMRALVLLFRGSAEIVSIDGPSLWNVTYSTPTKEFKAPATLRLKKRVPVVNVIPRFRRKALFNRDDWQCQYCGIDLDDDTVTIDHIIPKTRGGPRSWKNCVTSCKRCNMKKGSRSLSESGLTLLKNPTSPKMHHFWDVQKKNFEWHNDWKYFLKKT